MFDALRFLAFAVAFAALPAFAALKPGDPAPDFTSQASIGGGRIVYVYTSMNPDKHVANTLDALRTWTREQRKH